MSGPAAPHVPVAIVGGGPNGIALANLLGGYGVKTVVIEREREILEYPRAGGTDDEALRLGEELTSLAQDEACVTLQVRDATGQTSTLRCDYCVAADGGCNAPLDAPYTALNCDPRRPNVCIYLPYGCRRCKLADWFAAHPGNVIVLRPDRDIAAQCDPADLAEVTRQFTTFTCEPQRDQRLAA